ncbi:MAG TPA: GtrA family protein [Thermomicrobiaceae bacterium]|nr:GtrA family protein [Thermomicrobiaceae bacterium]
MANVRVVRKRPGPRLSPSQGQPNHQEQPQTWTRRRLTDLQSERARLLRFIICGGTASVIQLSILHVFLGWGWMALPADALSIFLGAQVNFLLSSTITWHDRKDGACWWRRWVGFHCAIAGTASLNLAVFTLASLIMPHLVAAALGIGVAAVCNFLAGDRLIFRSARATKPNVQSQTPAV